VLAIDYAKGVAAKGRVRHAESGCVESVKEFRADFLHDDVGVGFAIEQRRADAPNISVAA
jgi:hypothetical protein